MSWSTRQRQQKRQKAECSQTNIENQDGLSHHIDARHEWIRRVEWHDTMTRLCCSTSTTTCCIVVEGKKKKELINNKKKHRPSLKMDRNLRSQAPNCIWIIYISALLRSAPYILLSLHRAVMIGMSLVWIITRNSNKIKSIGRVDESQRRTVVLADNPRSGGSPRLPRLCCVVVREALLLLLLLLLV